MGKKIRTCQTCQTPKEITDFPLTRKRSSGITFGAFRQKICRLCKNSYWGRSKYYDNNPEKKRQKQIHTNNWANKQRDDLTDIYISRIILDKRAGDQQPTQKVIRKRRLQIQEKRAKKQIESENPGSKFCWGACKLLKPLICFAKDVHGCKGRLSVCRECASKKYIKDYKYMKENLTDSFILGKLTRNTSLKFADIPQTLINLKRSEIAARRAINEHQNKC